MSHSINLNFDELVNLPFNIIVSQLINNKNFANVFLNTNKMGEYLENIVNSWREHTKNSILIDTNDLFLNTPVISPTIIPSNINPISEPNLLS